jgi:hypothetical protein
VPARNDAGILLQRSHALEFAAVDDLGDAAADVGRNNEIGLNFALLKRGAYQMNNADSSRSKGH